MKHLCITYHMEKPNENEIAESCITLPMTEEIAADVMEHQESSFNIPIIENILTRLAKLQGYQGASFTCAHDNG